MEQATGNPGEKQAILFINLKPNKMAYYTAVNSQITDSITQANTEVLGSSPSLSLGNLNMATSQALSNAAHNATSIQHQASVTAQATTTQGVATLYAVETASAGMATRDIYGMPMPKAVVVKG